MIKTTIPKKTMLSCTCRKSLKETIYLKKKEMQRRNMGDVIKVTLTIYNLLNVSLDKYTNVCLKCFVFCNWFFIYLLFAIKTSFSIYNTSMYKL